MGGSNTQQNKLIKDELLKLINAKTTKEWEQNLESLLEKISTNSLFLNTLSLVLNTHSFSKLILNNFLEKLWKNLQLPNKKDQERTLYLIHELQFKIHQLEKEIKKQNLKTKTTISPINSTQANKIPDTALSLLKTQKSPNNITNLA